MSRYPTDWSTVTLGDSGKWYSGGTPNTGTPEYWSGDIPWISSGSLTNFRLSDSDRRVTKLGASNGTRVVSPGTILMVVRGMSLKSEFRIGMAMRPMAFGQDCKALVAGEGIDPEFLAYAIRAQTPRILGLVDEAGHGTGRLNSDQLFAVQIGLPSAYEQRAIAEVLGALDDKIAANTKLAETSADLAGSVFSEAVGHERVASQLMQVAQNVPGKYLPKDEYVEDGEYYVYGSNSVMGKYDRALCTGNFTVLAKIGSYCGNLRWSQRPAWVNNNASAIVPLEGVNPWILRHALENLDMGPHRAGTGQPYIRMESLFSAAIDLPSPECSERISPVLESLAETETVATEENRALAATRDTLLPQLMSGKLRVKDIENTMGEMV